MGFFLSFGSTQIQWQLISGFNGHKKGHRIHSPKICIMNKVKVNSKLGSENFVCSLFGGAQNSRERLIFSKGIYTEPESKLHKIFK